MEGSSNSFLSASARIQDYEYLYASNTNVSNFVSVKLLGKHNYIPWKAQMLCLLNSINVAGILDDTFVGPTKTSVRQYDNLVRGWIFGSVSEDVLLEVCNLDSAKAVWEKLQSNYDATMLLQEDSTQRNSYAKAEIELETKTKETEIEIIVATEIVPNETEIENEDTQNIENKNQQKKRLRAATIKGDWSKVESILKNDDGLATEAISSDGSTILHIAVGIGHNDIVKNLMSFLNDEQVLKQRDSDGSTSLHIAAIVGNKEAAEHLVKTNIKLLQIKDRNGEEPLHKAYKNMHLDTIVYLLKAVNEYVKTVLQPGSLQLSDKIAVDLLVNAISAKQYSIALELVQNFPKSASKSDDVLMAIAKTFPSGLDYGETLIYPYSLDNIIGALGALFSAALLYFGFPVYTLWDFKFNRYKYNYGIGFLLLLMVIAAVPVLLASPFVFICLLILIVFFIFQLLYSIWWKGAKMIFGPIKRIENKKKEWDEAEKVLERICDEIDKLEHSGTHHPHYTRPILEAASHNAYKVVDEILFRSPEAIQSTDKSGYDIIQLAIINRSEKIYNLIYDIGERKNVYRTYKDSFANNILHLAGRLAPSSVLNQRTGAALQLQRELKWREELKKFVFPTYITQENIFKETPDMVFTREHKDLVKEGELWMKTTAESCSITAALIITIVFAAAITVPGGSHQENRKPLFKKKIPFIIFAISDAISLFSSSTALLVFLSILTARFSEKDFLVSLPRRLFIGLSSLILSTTTMMIAFSATVFLVFCDEKQWLLAPLCGLAFIPIAFFVGLQFPLMVDLFRSTYIRIFGKQRKSILRRFNPDEIRLRFGTNIEGSNRGVERREKSQRSWRSLTMRA